VAKSVFYDITDDADEAANLTARSILMIAIEQRIQEEGWTQTVAAGKLGVSQPRVSDLVNGKIDKFSLDALVNMLPAVGLAMQVSRSSTKYPTRVPIANSPTTAPRARSTAAAAQAVKPPRVAAAASVGRRRSK
jgi:predicted XRE-type DNA-binding protein